MRADRRAWPRERSSSVRRNIERDTLLRVTRAAEQKRAVRSRRVFRRNLRDRSPCPWMDFDAASSAHCL